MTDAFQKALVFHVAGSDQPNYYKIPKFGMVLFQDTDPQLGAQIQTARAQGKDAGIWAVPSTGDPVAFAHHINDLLTSLDAKNLNPHLVMLDIEFVGKGWPGSTGWNYSESLMAEYRKLRPTRKTAMTTMPLQDDANYGAYGSRGGHVFPQCYGAKLDQPVDVAACVNRIVKDGVDPRKVHPVLAAGQSVIQAPQALAS